MPAAAVAAARAEARRLIEDLGFRGRIAYLGHHLELLDDSKIGGLA